jgi:hypothetical protein
VPLPDHRYPITCAATLARLHRPFPGRAEGFAVSYHCVQATTLIAIAAARPPVPSASYEKFERPVLPAATSDNPSPPPLRGCEIASPAHTVLLRCRLCVPIAHAPQRDPVPPVFLDRGANENIILSHVRACHRPLCPDVVRLPRTPRDNRQRIDLSDTLFVPSGKSNPISLGCLIDRGALPSVSRDRHAPDLDEDSRVVIEARMAGRSVASSSGTPHQQPCHCRYVLSLEAPLRTLGDLA